MDLRKELEKIYNGTSEPAEPEVFDNDFSAFADDPDEFGDSDDLDDDDLDDDDWDLDEDEDDDDDEFVAYNPDHYEPF